MEQLEANVNILIDECARKMKNTYSWCFVWARFWTQGNQNPRRGCFCVFPWIMWVVMNTVITHFWQSPTKSEPTTCKNDFNSLDANWRLKGCFLTDPNLGLELGEKKKSPPLMAFLKANIDKVNYEAWCVRSRQEACPARTELVSPPPQSSSNLFNPVCPSAWTAFRWT